MDQKASGSEGNRSGNRSDIATAEIRTGEYVAADGAHMLGRIQGDHWFGFWAYTLDGERLPCAFPTIEEAAEVLALEFRIGYGAVA
jgi:hypothetical protein